MTAHTVDLVIARYEENLSWLPKVFLFRNVWIYNKGSKLLPKHVLPHNLDDHNVKVIHLENLGRCDHTYLYHIVHQYDNLADVTIFLPGSSTMNTKLPKVVQTIQKAFQTESSVFVNAVQVNDVRRDIYQFTLNTYTATCQQNAAQNPESNLFPAKIRPFGKWYESYLGSEPYPYLMYQGIFAVSRDHIKNRDVSLYQRLMDEVGEHSNPEVGHYIERIWMALFRIEEKYLFGRGRV